jgi:hypothetical protein
MYLRTESDPFPPPWDHVAGALLIGVVAYTDPALTLQKRPDQQQELLVANTASTLFWVILA